MISDREDPISTVLQGKQNPKPPVKNTWKKNKKYIFLHIYNGKTLKGLAELYAETNAHKQGKKKHVQQAHVFRIFKRESFPNVNKSFFLKEYKNAIAYSFPVYLTIPILTKRKLRSASIASGGSEKVLLN